MRKNIQMYGLKIRLLTKVHSISIVKSSINILNYQQNGIWKYGGSQSKLFQYLASGKPIVSNIVPGYCLIRQHECGISSEFKTADEYASAFESLRNLSEEEYLKCVTILGKLHKILIIRN